MKKTELVFVPTPAAGHHISAVEFANYISHVKYAITHLMSSRSSPESVLLAGLVLDFFWLPMIDVANQLGLPSYLYFTFGAGFLGLMLSPPTRHSQIGTEFEDSDPDLELPSFVNPVPIRFLPEAVSNKHGGYAAFIKFAQRFKEAKGIIVNMFLSWSLTPLSRSLMVKPPPPGVHDAQLELFVVFLCFGSMGNFDAPQVREIALGLERSGHKLSWASAEAGWQTWWKL
ncbi:UDP-glycosyltransferase 71E1-like [Vitis riparia]|uniref:UDP-glycosyltransferase 71E1-like n=1 Tax=Vitis riparia TaxID=96939 RepID=UPI00155A6F17|nr:UDP-glycosyltransferase 71E1-like [Vitis riparia]